MAIKNSKLVFGRGYCGIGKYRTRINGKHTVAYIKWYNMFYRCYSDEYHKKSPSYTECSVDERWYNFQVFAEWFEDKYSSGYQLDKDLLLKGNKIYSPETCCLIPKEINISIMGCIKSRGDYPLGVFMKRGRFKAEISKDGKSIDLGSYDTPEEAFEAYKIAKESWLKELANKWKGRISNTSYEALYKWEILITD